MRSPLVALALGIAALAAPLPAATPLAAPAAPLASVASRSGFRAEGLEVSLAEGQLEVRATSLWLDPGTRLDGVVARLPLELDEGFYQAPLSGILAAFGEHLDLTATRFESQASGLYTLSDLAVRVRAGAMTMVGRKGVQVRAEGQLAVDLEGRRLVVTLEKLRAGILPVPMAVAFGVLGRILQAPFVELARPEVRVDMAPFLR